MTEPYAQEATPPLTDITEAIRGVCNLVRQAEIGGQADGDDAHGGLLAIGILNALLRARLFPA